MNRRGFLKSLIGGAAAVAMPSLVAEEKGSLYYDTTTDLVSAIRAIDQQPVPVGYISHFVDKVPDGWVLCDGRQLDKEIYSDLYNALGNTYGQSTTTFNVPDLNPTRFNVPDLRSKQIRMKDKLRKKYVV